MCDLIGSNCAHHPRQNMLPISPNSCSLLPNELVSIMQGNDAATDVSLEGFESNPSSISVISYMSNLLYSLGVLKERVYQAESLVSLLASSSSFADQHSEFQVEPTSSMIRIRVSNLVQDIVSVSSSMMFTCQQMSLSLDNTLEDINPSVSSVCQRGLSQRMHSGPDGDGERNNHEMLNQDMGQEHKHGEILGSSMFESGDQSMKWCASSEDFINASLTDTTTTNTYQTGHYETIIEMDAADILAEYTHHCQVCDKGFKRDANLRMHMRAHGDEYKSNAALSNPKKSNLDEAASLSSLKMVKRYSCPQDGCRWNRKHPKFQPLKSMICIKNHYKRSHCPKMYVCQRCHQKEFSVVSDLRTHEKHCGDSKWRCSCGTNFSRKDKLLSHVELFRGHFPIVGNHGFCGNES